jgi:hypothetical protein
MIEELIARVFAARNAAHLQHWRTKSYSQHIALGEFYDSVIDGIDSIVEAYQGVFELVSVGSLPEQKKQTDIISLLEDDLLWISKNRAKLCKGLPAIDNLLQGLEDSYLKALYKLKNLS